MKNFITNFQNFKRNKSINKTLINAGWLVGEKIFTLIIGIFVIGLVARYLGPESYGTYNYALAFVTLFATISTLGLETLSVKAIVHEDEEEGTILFTGLILRIIGGIFLTVLSGLIIRYLEPNDSLLHSLVFILSLTMIFRALEVIEYWIQAYQKSKVSSLIRMSVFLVSAVLKIIFVIFEGDLLELSIIYMFDALMIGSGLMIAYHKSRNTRTKWIFKIQYAKNILSQSWYLILSGIMVTLYMQIDKVMLGSMLPSKVELGIYSAATQVSTIWYFIPIAIITSFKPIVMKKKKINNEDYLNTLQILYSIVTWIGIIFGFIVILSSDLIVSILYGNQYKDAVNIIIISVWAGTFATLGSARSVWLLMENLQGYTIVYTTVGLLVNLYLNYLWIPLYEGTGAAFATLIAQFIANVFALGIFKKTRISTIMIIKSFNPNYLLNFRKNCGLK